jgi:hypothetical protein
MFVVLMAASIPGDLTPPEMHRVCSSRISSAMLLSERPALASSSTAPGTGRLLRWPDVWRLNQKETPTEVGGLPVSAGHLALTHDPPYSTQDV